MIVTTITAISVTPIAVSAQKIKISGAQITQFLFGFVVCVVLGFFWFDWYDWYFFYHPGLMTIDSRQCTQIEVLPGLNSKTLHLVHLS